MEAPEAVRRPAAHARGRRAGPAFPGARAGLRPGPSPRRAARARTLDAPSLCLRGREQGAALPGPRRRLTRKDVCDRVPAPGQIASSSRCSSGGSAGDGDGGAWAGRLGGSARAAHTPSAAGRAAAGARSFRPRHAAAAAAPRGLGAKLPPPPPPPPPSPRSASAAPQPPREHVPGGERARSARAGRATEA